METGIGEAEKGTAVATYHEDCLGRGVVKQGWMGFLCESRSIGLVGNWNYRCFDGFVGSFGFWEGILDDWRGSGFLRGLENGG
jgi:hypothetical protein